MAGRPRKPEALKNLQGKDATGAACPEVVSAPIDKTPPPSCSLGARREWKYIMDNCPDGVLQVLDRKLLIHYCETAAAYDEAIKAWDAEGRSFAYFADNGQGKVDPHYRVVLDTGAALRAVCSSLGFTPTTRGKIQMAVRNGDKKENPFASFQS